MITVFSVQGIVQGVGFRPLAYRLAVKHGLQGTVRNSGGSVTIIARGPKSGLDAFIADLSADTGSQAEIFRIAEEVIPETDERWRTAERHLRAAAEPADPAAAGFCIIDSDDNGDRPFIPPDLPVCPACRAELFDPHHRQFGNPFISCVSCGPRYSVIESLPYDRPGTSLKEFPLCPDCAAEYGSSGNRRFHAQTISCNHCGPFLRYGALTRKAALEAAAEAIRAGGIVAVKGIGGYHFACTPFREDTVENLRTLKGREEKPFAVMFESVDSVRDYCAVSGREAALLESRARPIVLLRSDTTRIAPSVLKGSLHCGAFLPYTALQILLIARCGPLIMTSANISNSPIIFDDAAMATLESPLISGILSNDRKIVRPVEDSVAKVTDGATQINRRGRGYVPYPIHLTTGNTDRRIFAAGGDLKAAFSLYANGSAVVSPFLGDLEDRSALDAYGRSVVDLCNLFRVDPDRAVCDLHPDYFSAKYATSLGIPLLRVQHHHAHVASVMAEHDIRGPVIGVAFDGTGFGADGTVWGGEFLICEGAEFERYAHLPPVAMVGGDQSMKDALKSATCFLLHAGLDEYITDDRLGVIRAAIENKVNTVLSSSMGRLFDAAAAILGLASDNRYEGECAGLLEKAACLDRAAGKTALPMSFTVDRKNSKIEIDSRSVLESVCRSARSDGNESAALGFHFAVAGLILDVCRLIRADRHIDAVALSGGVFQNGILMEQSLSVLRGDGFKVYYNTIVPPNDGSISLGQTYIALMR